MKIFPVFYFGPIDYFGQLISVEDYRFEAWENFSKQTYRNRCYILGANGKLRLAIPIKHNGKRNMRDIEISYDYPWQKEHLRSIQAAYRRSPYFEYYEDEFLPFFEEKEKYLLDLNLKTLKFIDVKLNLGLKLELSDTYDTKDIETDYREHFDAKVEEKTGLTEYPQVFEEKFGFISNLSIIDLLCNEGPASATYLKKCR